MAIKIGNEHAKALKRNDNEEKKETQEGQKEIIS